MRRSGSMVHSIRRVTVLRLPTTAGTDSRSRPSVMSEGRCGGMKASLAAVASGSWVAKKSGTSTIM